MKYTRSNGEHFYSYRLGPVSLYYWPGGQWAWGGCYKWFELGNVSISIKSRRG
jgi:hypothetical protein